MKRFRLLLFLSITMMGFVHAQIPQASCGADLFFEQQCNQHPEYKASAMAMRENLQQYLQAKENKAQWRNEEVYTIPVVVHIVWWEEADNVSDEEVYGQMAVINELFRGKNLNAAFIPAEFRAVFADIGLEFCLASTDPEGNPSNGITRTQTDVKDIGNFRLHTNNRGEFFLFQSQLGGADAWDTDRYLNIWVASAGGEIQGYGTTPNEFRPWEDGVIVDPLYFGNNCELPFNLGRVTVHEIGHYFGLLHPWGQRTGCETDDDLVADTPLQDRPYQGCPSYPAISCGSSDMFMNYMDYTDDACMSMFTIGQKERMRAMLLTSRSGLLESSLCSQSPINPTFEFTVYPNPASDCVHIRYNSEASEVVQVRLFDAAGRLLYQESHLPNTISAISTIEFPTGIYLLQVIQGDEQMTEKLLIETP
ncbi:MAG: M43 family zinc metalloprotease [Bacteroidota bacterium]